jgi:hypothetical protein
MSERARSIGLPGQTVVFKYVRGGIVVALALLTSVPLVAQQSGGTMGNMGTMGNPGTAGSGATMGSGSVVYSGGSSTPSYGSGKAVGIGVGAAAAGIGAVYLLMHRSSSITGCILSGDDGLRLIDDKTNRTFAVFPSGTALVPGEHVQLRGKILKAHSGEQEFEAKKLIKNLGACSTSQPR